MKKSTKFFLFLLSVLLLFSLIPLLAFLGYRLNTTASYPRGIYHLDSTNKQLYRGKMVMFCPPKREIFDRAVLLGYISQYSMTCTEGYTPLIKKIAGLPGDKVTLDRYVYINGIKQPNSDIYQLDPQGNPMGILQKRSFVIPEDAFFAMSDYNPLSFDSRYFGTIPLARILGEISPVWTWESEIIHPQLPHQTASTLSPLSTHRKTLPVLIPSTHPRQ